MKQDIVPGMEIPFHFQADQIGIYEVPCSELCGLGHHQMRTTLEVMTPENFEKWKQEQAAAEVRHTSSILSVHNSVGERACPHR